MSAGEVQDVLDSLADTLSRSLTLDGPEGDLLAHSIRGDDSDRARVTSILRRSVAPDVHAWQLRHVDLTVGTLQRVPANAAMELSARRCFVVRSPERCVALLWLLDDGTPLADPDLDALREASAELARLLAGRDRPGARLRVVATGDGRPPVVVASDAELRRAVTNAPPGAAVGVSDPGEPDRAAGAALVRQAVLAARISADDPSVPSPAHWSELGVYRWLDGDPPNPDPLAPLDSSPSGPMLLETLEAYLDHAGDVRATAAQLRLHRSSLYYRLDRLAAVLATTDLGDGLVRLELHLAVKQRRWARVSR